MGEGGELRGVDAVEDGVPPPGFGGEAGTGPAGTGEGLSGGEACEEDCGDAGEQQILRDAQDDKFRNGALRM